MNEENRYNGWHNYATWRVNLELCDDITSSLIGEQTFESVAELAEHLEEEVDQIITSYGEAEESIALSYARAFLSDVDWWEIAEASADELVKTADFYVDTPGYEGVIGDSLTYEQAVETLNEECDAWEDDGWTVERGLASEGNYAAARATKDGHIRTIAIGREQ